MCIRDRPITLKNIFFESGSAILKEESYFELKQLLQFLKDHTIVSLLVTGYTDNIGSETDNIVSVSYTHLRAHETVLDLVCRLLLEKKNNNKHINNLSITIMHITT